MSNYFTNEDPGLVTNTSGSFGIIPGSINPAQIVDGLTERGASLGKLGSSMPSPMARLYLFSAALREVNAMEAKNPGEGHNGVYNPTSDKVEATPYHDLVGELLDMLEFIFQYGDYRDFHVYRWNCNNECAELNNSGTPAHKNLASALQSAFSYGVLQNQPVFLFKWKDHVIGGSSPITLVYTSANLRELIKDNNYSFIGHAGNVLFTDDPWPLHERDIAFQDYLYRLRYTDLNRFAAQEPIYQLVQYIQDSASNYMPDLEAKIKRKPEDYTRVKDLTSHGQPIDICGVQLKVSDHIPVIDKTTSDYILKPTVDRYKHDKDDVKTPLALTKGGVKSLKYASDRVFNENTDKIIAPDPDLSKRKLPGLDVTYPYLTVSDFLEDKIIEVSYAINNEAFFTGSKRPITYLLPLKKLFFEYFDLADLFDDNGNSTDMLTLVHDDEASIVTVELKLPLINGHVITFHKQYKTRDANDKVDCYDSSNTFGLAMFPFYRLHPDTSKNVYNAMLGYTVQGDVTLEFYELSANGLDQVEATSKLRSRLGVSKSQLTTAHIRINGAFSFIQLSLPDGTNALLLPLFEKIESDPTNATQRCSFSIDFGTTNTHVAYASVSANNVVGHDSVLPFEYTEADTQMKTLHSKSGVVEFGAFNTAIKRELVPQVLGTTIKFPMRTATYQISGMPNSLEMFFSSNIGFNYGEDISSSAQYKTNIKWGRYDTLSADRMSTYFAQMLWMMKNKSVQNHGSTKFDLVVTYPISMPQRDQDSFRAAWERAKRDVKCDVEIFYKTESVAPYYSYLQQLQYGDPYANMDIGGGTTDIFYYDPESKEASVFSAFFAANDLWNDGLDALNRANKENGFLEFYTRVKSERLGDKKAEFDGVKQMAASSEDVISYLFANDSWSRLSDTIKSSPIMSQLLVVHFSALIFYAGYTMYMANYKPPTKLSFTGMGSKYIKLISSNEQSLSKLVNAIFHYVGKQFNDERLSKANVSVSFANNPKEVTAKGALLSRVANRQINPSEDLFYGYMDEADKAITLRYRDLNDNLQNQVIGLFDQFLGLFTTDEIIDVFDYLGCQVNSDVIGKLKRYARSSYQEMLSNSITSEQQKQQKVTEPLFFWPMKNSLYVISKELVGPAVDDLNLHT